MSKEGLFPSLKSLKSLISLISPAACTAEGHVQMHLGVTMGQSWSVPHNFRQVQRS